ncbi:MAG: hypothetical protein BWX88_05318 [Planctomycetes bacterium ADurb.Bin126]|nr:MAG: hypothetical protein BWX88_05318 [Planctomycetes bacterium ADurb.Bin126]HOD81419.1 hypothetical protein [Phycisphaerae bacterium]HQL74735.1 hypothetical protein [Phycisphaerae bacterium]
MLALTQKQILVIAALLVVYVFFAYRVSRQMARNGHNQWLWFVLSVLLTSLPAAIVMTHERFSWLWTRTREEQARRSGRIVDPGPAEAESQQDELADDETGSDVPGMIRCPHCRTLFAPVGPADPSGLTPCPRCGQTFEQEYLA